MGVLSSDALQFGKSLFSGILQQILQGQAFGANQALDQDIRNRLEDTHKNVTGMWGPIYDRTMGAINQGMERSPQIAADYQQSIDDIGKKVSALPDEVLASLTSGREQTMGAYDNLLNMLGGELDKLSDVRSKDIRTDYSKAAGDFGASQAARGMFGSSANLAGKAALSSQMQRDLQKEADAATNRRVDVLQTAGQNKVNSLEQALRDYAEAQGKMGQWQVGAQGTLADASRAAAMSDTDRQLALMDAAMSAATNYGNVERQFQGDIVRHLQGVTNAYPDISAALANQANSATNMGYQNALEALPGPWDQFGTNLLQAGISSAVAGPMYGLMNFGANAANSGLDALFNQSFSAVPRFGP